MVAGGGLFVRSHPIGGGLFVRSHPMGGGLFARSHPMGGACSKEEGTLSSLYGTSFLHVVNTSLFASCCKQQVITKNSFSRGRVLAPTACISTSFDFKFNKAQYIDYIPKF